MYAKKRLQSVSAGDCEPNVIEKANTLGEYAGVWPDVIEKPNIMSECWDVRARCMRKSQYGCCCIPLESWWMMGETNELRYTEMDDPVRINQNGVEACDNGGLLRL
ncbi:hypothetical protein C162_27477 [Paenibacillus sp. FSL R7-269]|nr:hypothetical protein C162_27477 [Paenibacillus sp. FSL R7-269]